MFDTTNVRIVSKPGWLERGQCMSEELNPTAEENTAVAETTETPTPETTVPEPTTADPVALEPAAPEPAAPEATAPEATATEATATEATVEETVNPETPTAVAAPVESAPAAVPASPAPQANENTGPREFSPEHDGGGGGRGRRTSVDARYEDVHYKNVPLLTRFIDQRGRILSRRKTRVSAKVQRRVVKSIKWARHLALLPYTSEQTRIVRRRR
jgi:small subunit ribosomal protein S18